MQDTTFKTKQLKIYLVVVYEKINVMGIKMSNTFYFIPKIAKFSTLYIMKFSCIIEIPLSFK